MESKRSFLYESGVKTYLINYGDREMSIKIDGLDLSFNLNDLSHLREFIFDLLKGYDRLSKTAEENKDKPKMTIGAEGIVIRG